VKIFEFITGKGRMADEMYQFVRSGRDSGKLIQPETAGAIMARLILGMPKDLSGKSFNWNDRELVSFRGE
jgi:hypothetical protein